jgi:hypothetical protein
MLRKNRRSIALWDWGAGVREAAPPSLRCERRSGFEIAAEHPNLLPANEGVASGLLGALLRVRLPAGN